MNHLSTPDWESIHEQQLTAPRFCICPDCEGFKQLGYCGYWKSVIGGEEFIRCNTCGGTGKVKGDDV